MPHDYITDVAEGISFTEMGPSIAKSQRNLDYLPLPGYQTKDVIIQQMIEANQLLRDQVIYYRDELVKQHYEHQQRLADRDVEINVLRGLHEASLASNAERQAKRVKRQQSRKKIARRKK
jgi:hypothetical protein